MTDEPEFLFEGPTDAARTIVLAHGAGASMDSPFMEFFAQGLCKHNIRVARFEFPYMNSYRKTGKMKPPDREPILRETWLKVIELVRVPGLIIGGKSMGGRIASLVADEAGVSGLFCLGYPFHPTGQPERLRVEHLDSIKTPTLILQGERDPFGSREEVVEYKLSSAVRVVWLEDGDHSFKPRKATGRTEDMNWQSGLDEMVKFVESLPIENNQR